MAKEVVIIIRNGPEQNRSVLSHYSVEQNHMHVRGAQANLAAQ